jgi:hypothetical protein
LGEYVEEILKMDYERTSRDYARKLKALGVDMPVLHERPVPADELAFQHYITYVHAIEAHRQEMNM